MPSPLPTRRGTAYSHLPGPRASGWPGGRNPMKFQRQTLLILCSVIVVTSAAGAGTKVDFRADGICRVDGKPFFPIGVWVYAVTGEVMADLREHRCNVVVGSGV